MLWILVLLFATVHGRCLYRHPHELVPFELVHGIPGGVDNTGTFSSYAVFNWTFAIPYYRYRVIESYPEDAATNALLGSTNDVTDETTTLAVFRRHPEEHISEHVLHNIERYRIVIQVSSDCAPKYAVTQATYFVNLTASFTFRHNFTSGPTNLTTAGWEPAPTLVMHPDIQRELVYVVHINQSHFISVASRVTIEGGEDGLCAGVNSSIGTPCYAVLNVSIIRTVNNIRDIFLEPIDISYGLSQFTRDDCTLNATFNGSIPADFNVSRTEPSTSYVDRRFDMCEGFFRSNGTVTERARDDYVSQDHAIHFHSVNASCTYRIFNDHCSMSPFIYVMGWFDYGYINPFMNQTQLGTVFYNLTN